MADFIFDISTIVQGNNGNKLPLTIRNNGTVHAIEGATVRVTIKRGTSVFTKQAVITDAASGKCEIVLSSEDLTAPGLYFYQPTIAYTDGREISGDVSSFTVRGKLSGEAPPVTVPAGIDLSRLGISANNRLTIDGIEQIGGTGGGTTEPLPSNVILFEDWVGGESVTIDTSTTPPTDTTAPVLTISPAGGNFASTQGVTMTTNETADIYYTLDGSTPTTASTKYTAALSLSATTTLKAFARDTAGNSSAVQTVTFTKDVTAPADTTAPIVTASPAAGTYTTAQSVTLTANETATIYYTTNGTTPTTASNVYSAPINIAATTTLQFMAKDTAGNQSAPVAATYTINIPQADTTAPVLTMTAAATFADTQMVTMSANETADIWYTVDGSDPVASGTRVKYTAPVTLTATTTVKAYAVDTAGNKSAVQTVVYTKQSATNQAVVYPENGYLMMPPNQYTWNGLTGQSDANYVRVASSYALSSLFDQTGSQPITFDNLPFVTYSATHTVDYYENVSIGSGSNVGKIAIKLSTSKGADAASINSYLQTTDKMMGIKLATGYKTLTIPSVVSNVTTRTGGVDTTKFEYVKCNLSGIGDYITPASYETHFASNGFDVFKTTDYVYSTNRPSIRINSADSTLEMLLPIGTLASFDVAGVSAYISAVNLKIYYM